MNKIISIIMVSCFCIGAVAGCVTKEAREAQETQQEAYDLGYQTVKDIVKNRRSISGESPEMLDSPIYKPIYIIPDEEVEPEPYEPEVEDEYEDEYEEIEYYTPRRRRLFRRFIR